MDFTDREVALLVAALATLSHDFELADQQVADDAWDLAREIAVGNDIEPETAVRQLR